MTNPLTNVLVVDRLGTELVPELAAARPDLEVRERSFEDVARDDFSWANVVVGFRLPAFVSGDMVRRLSWVHSTGAGVDGFLGQSAWPEAVPLTRTTGRFGERIGEYCVAHALADCQHLHQFRAWQRQRLWNVLPARDLAGSRALILGTGSVGQGIARAFSALGVRTTGLSRSGASAAGFDEVHEVAQLTADLGVANWIVVALPLTPATRGLLGRAELAGARGAYLINVGRGAVAPEADLLWALEFGALARCESRRVRV